MTWGIENAIWVNASQNTERVWSYTQTPRAKPVNWDPTRDTSWPIQMMKKERNPFGAVWVVMVTFSMTRGDCFAELYHCP
jgi:hypothetical protein